MTKNEKIGISEHLAFLYGVDANSEYMQHGFNVQATGTWLIDDIKRMFELAVENSITIRPNNLRQIATAREVSDVISNASIEEYKNYCSGLEATLVAIAKALIKLKEQQ